MPSRSHVLRSGIAAVLTLVLAASPASSQTSDEASALTRTKQEIALIRKRVAQAKGEAAAIQRQISALDRQIGLLGRQIRSGQTTIGQMESEIRSAEAKISELEKQYGRARAASNERARRLYKGGSEGFVARLLSARSLGDFARVLFWWEVAAEMDGKAMLDATRLRGDLAERREDLGRGKQALSRSRSGLEQRRELLGAAHHERSTALASVEQRIAAEERHIRELDQQARELTARLRASTLSRSSTGTVSQAGLIWPVRGGVTSGYGRRRGGFHHGIDIDGNSGDPIRAAKAGVVADISCGSGYGICTIIDHGGGLATLYAHMSRRSVAGGRVEQGQVIGAVGCTGSCSGPHLHFEVRVNGEPRNPSAFLP